MTKVLQRFFQDTSGATALEYGLLVAFFSTALLATYGVLSARLNGKFAAVATALQ